MKILIPLTMLAALFAVIVSFASITEKDNEPEAETIEIQEDAKAVIDNSCYGCHFSGSKNEKGKKKLKFDQLDSLSTAKLVGTLMEIAEVVEDGDMPPKKFLEFKPEAKPSEAQRQKIISWAKSAAEEASK